MTYDNLHRLSYINATGLGTGTAYNQTFTYSSIGNITSVTGTGGTVYPTTQYNGSAGSSYANPHAATKIGGVNRVYDQNGNMLGNGALSNTWNYKNELTQTVVGANTMSYTYDHNGDRMTYTNPTATTITPSKEYEVTGTLKKKSLYLGDELIATIEDNAGTITPHFAHADHLFGSSVMTSNTGTQDEVVDYYPFGEIRIDTLAGTFKEKRKHTGQVYDVDTGLYYFGSRYNNAAFGRFISQDPVFIAIGDNRKIKSMANMSLDSLLTDPQMLNSYSYARNNPLRYIDPDGNLAWDTLLRNPVQSANRVVGWGLASLGANVMNKPFTASLIRHSTSLEPGNISISAGNQKQYGNPIDKIKETSQYKAYMSETIKDAENGKMSNSGHFQFENRSDLYYSLHGANIESQVTNDNGEWVINNTVSDTYDFNSTNPQTYKGTVTRIPATQAYKDQQGGYLSNYGIEIQFTDKIKK